MMCGFEIFISESMMQRDLNALRPRYIAKLRSDYEIPH